MNDQITRTFGPITVDNVTPHTYKAGISQAQLRQVVTTTYPSVRVGNSKSDSLFAVDAFNLPAGQSFESTRVTWTNVPNGTTVEQVTEILAATPNARIYRQISHKVEDVMTDEQKQAVTAGLRTIEEFQDQLRVRRVNENTGEIEEIEGKPQYRQNFFSKTAKADEDFRNAGAPTAADVEHQTATNGETKVETVKTEEKAELTV